MKSSWFRYPFSVVFTKAAGGDEALALFNSSFGNIIAVGITTALLIMFLGVSTTGMGAFVFFKLVNFMFSPRDGE